jgi:hypothetical protein
MGAVTPAGLPSQWLLKRDPETTPVVVDASGLDEDSTFARIQCPHCAWRPAPSSTWACDGPDGTTPGFGGCGTVWNTFHDARPLPGLQSPVAVDQLPPVRRPGAARGLVPAAGGGLTTRGTT